MALRVDAHRGLLLLAAVPYDDATVDWIRTLPERYYRPRSQVWCVPARRELLYDVLTLMCELEERDIAVNVSDRASARLSSADVGRAILRDNAIEITGPYSPRRLSAVRSLPERRFDATRKTWTVPLTRAGALAVLDLADHTDELVLTRRARLALQRSASHTDVMSHVRRDRPPTAAGPTRRSPIAHGRHYTRGPIFENPARERVDVAGIGLCVRIRVDSTRKSDACHRAPAPDPDTEHGGHG